MGEVDFAREKPHALVVDDERYMRTILRDALEAGDWVVSEAENGKRALEMVRHRQPDVVLLDVVMPEMDGFATCSELRKLPEGRDVPILIVTALEDSGTINRTYAVGATDYIAKPINDSHLRHHLRYILRSSRLYEELRQKESRLSNAQGIARLGSWELDVGADEIHCSEEALRILGFSADEAWINLQAFLGRVHPEDRRGIEGAIRLAMETREPFDLDHRVLPPEGTVRFVHSQAQLHGDLPAHPVRLAGTIQDITERKQVEEKLCFAGKVFDNSSEMIVIADAQANIIDVNPAFCRLSGYSRKEAIGRNIRRPKSRKQDEQFHHDLWDNLARTGQWQGELWNRRKNGERFPALVTINAVRDEKGETTHYVSTAVDISKIKQAEHRLRHLAHYDSLTDLPNRLLFYDRLQQAMIFAGRTSGIIAVLLFDIDNFHEINETLGYHVGDHVLQVVARRVQGRLRKSDTVARLGSDEFAVVLRELVWPDNGALVAQRIQDVLEQPFTLEGKEFYVTASTGIALHPEDGAEAEELVKKAEAAMHFAKKEGKNRYQYFSEKMNTRALEKLALKTCLRHGLKRDEIFLHYQPKFDSQSGRLTGLEALARWRNEERGMVPPLEFIPVAEESGLIVPLGERVLGLACAQNMAWQGAGFDPFRVAVNLSAYQFRGTDLVGTVNRVLQETGLDPCWLELEITESAIMQDTERSIAILKRLKAMGIRIALDDFGTGYSSLSYLKRFPVDVLKIDYYFVKNIFVNAQDAAIVKAIIAMAHSLKLRVIAEGVETEEQRVFLREQGCDEVQGYLAGMPQSAEDVERCFSRRSATQ